ncbi:unnamed protein product [Strongylus vulgaris]|uniref:ZP domain-containing protein n=1 Tax=Strongylus vulgaris TaxID=40348 RepID=A0A3P7JAS7_STRVU|nr:unnamed protein product [Strongylus vulgaris]
MKLWTCEAEDNLQYCMTVHSCTADDGQGIGQQLIDERGCSLDNFLLKNLEYGDDLVAGQQAYVFKFADKPTIFFSCMIRLELKENDTSICPKHSNSLAFICLFTNFTSIATRQNTNSAGSCRDKRFSKAGISTV